MNPTAVAVLTRSAGAAAQDIFRRIFPGTPTTEQFKAAQIAMAEAALPAIRKFGEDSSKAPHNTEAYYAAVAPHNPLGPISLAAGVQIAASIPNFLCQEQVSLGEGYIKTPFVVRDGYLDLPPGPGLGIELDEHALADKIGHHWTNRESYDADDGSVVDW